MKILFVAAEVAPFSSIGGLSQVMYFLPRALAKLGHDARIFTAKYGVIDGSGGNLPQKKKWKFEMVKEGLEVPLGVGSMEQRVRQTASKSSETDLPTPDSLLQTSYLVCNVKSSRATKSDPLVYFLENREYYEMRANVYQYVDDHVRFALLSKGCLEWLRQQRSSTSTTGNTGTTREEKAEMDGARVTRVTRDTRGTSSWFPDLIHINDWHTGYLAEMARRDPRYKDVFKDVPIVYTIHNFRHQGNGSVDFRFGPPEERDRGKTPMSGLLDPGLLRVNALVRGILWSDVVNTVSKTHAQEILTSEYGEGVDDVLRAQKEKITGILNGIDTTMWNPAADRVIVQRFSRRSLGLRAKNKLALLSEFGLPAMDHEPRAMSHEPRATRYVPLLALSGRMDKQKGIDLLIEALPRLLAHFSFQLVVLGGGDEQYRKFFHELATAYPDRVGIRLQPDFELPRKIFAGADLLLLPSKFEPGGIVAMEAMRYGCVPLVRRTGGLNDIVTDFDPRTGQGNGLSFAAFDPWAFYGAVAQALELYKDQKSWMKLVKNCLASDFSWSHAAKEYETLYRRVIKKGLSS